MRRLAWACERLPHSPTQAELRATYYLASYTSSGLRDLLPSRGRWRMVVLMSVSRAVARAAGAGEPCFERVVGGIGGVQKRGMGGAIKGGWTDGGKEWRRRSKLEGR